MSAMSITLNTGASMPMVGLGTWKAPLGVTATVVYDAIKIGYRQLDCACDYGNEQEVGQGIRRALDEGVCKREDLFVTSKLWNTYHAKEHVKPACEKTLKDLGLEYVDLYLIHFPISLKFVPFEERYPPEWTHEAGAPMPQGQVFEPVPVQQTWQGMEELVDLGLAKAIGISNFSCVLTRDLLSYCRIKPAVNQVELHPYLVQPKLVETMQREGIVVTAFSPLGIGSYIELGQSGVSVLEESVIKAAAEAHGKTPGQVVLRWGVQRGYVIIPKSVRPERLKQNLELFDWSLTDAEMAAISGLDQHKRFNDPGVFADYPIHD